MVGKHPGEGKEGVNVRRRRSNSDAEKSNGDDDGNDEGNGIDTIRLNL